MVKTVFFNAEGTDSIPQWGTKVPDAAECGQKLKPKIKEGRLRKEGKGKEDWAPHSTSS